MDAGEPKLPPRDREAPHEDRDGRPEAEPKTAALTSPSAVVAALLLLGAIIAMTVAAQSCGADEERSGTGMSGHGDPSLVPRPESSQQNQGRVLLRPLA